MREWKDVGTEENQDYDRRELSENINYGIFMYVIMLWHRYLIE